MPTSNINPTSVEVAAHVVATIELEARSIHDASYPTAAWYRTFEHPAQTVEVCLSGEFAVYTIHGHTTHEHFPTLYGGVPTGSGTSGTCHKASTYSVQMQNYSAAAAVEAGTMTLTSNAQITETFHDHREYCLGSVNVLSAERGSFQKPCEHDTHEDAHGVSMTQRTKRGHLVHGYIPGVTTRVRHIKIAIRNPAEPDVVL